MSNVDKRKARIAFAKAMRRRRIRTGMSQEQVALEGIARSHVSDLERGLIEPRLSTLIQIANILQTSFKNFSGQIERNYARLETKEKEATK
jgi:transcriptional regulator with XRE-family HTH domain